MDDDNTDKIRKAFRDFLIGCDCSVSVFMSVCRCEGACCCLLVCVLLASEKASDGVKREPRGEGKGLTERERERERG